jgi:hypothetical protein
MIQATTRGGGSFVPARGGGKKPFSFLRMPLCADRTKEPFRPVP